MKSDNNENLNENPALVPESEKIAKHLESNFERNCISFKVDKDCESVDNFLNETFYPLINLPAPLPESFYTSAKHVVERIYGPTPKELRLTYFMLIGELVKFGARKCGDLDFPGWFLTYILSPLSNKKFGTWLNNLTESNWENFFPEIPVPVFTYIEEDKRNPHSFMVKYIANLFIEKGGVTNMVHKLQRPESSLYDVYYIVGEFTQVLGLWEISHCPDGGVTYSELKAHLANLFETKMVNFTVEQCKRVEFKQMTETIDRFKDLIFYFFKKPVIESRINKVYLEVSFKWLKLPYIQKRVKALLEINRYCDLLMQPNPIVEPDTSLYEIIMTKCREENMVQYLFKDSPHPELTKKCSPLLQFTIENKIFNENDIGIIWASSVDKHESIMHEVWKLFSDLTLPKTLLDHLYLKIKSIPPINYDGKFVDFVKTLTDKAVFLSHDLKNEPRRWYGLDLFWEQATMHGGNEYLKNQFLKALTECLSKDHFEIRRPVYLEYCVENLSNCDNFLQSRSSLTLLKEILTCMNLPQEQRRFATWLNNPEQRIVGKIFRIISKYNPGKLSKDDLATSKDLLNYMFDFLDFFLPICDNTLDSDQIDILWKHVIGDKFDVSEIIFKWLEKSCNVGLVSIGTLGYIFTEKFVREMYPLSSPGFSLFETLFRLYNIEQHKISVETFKPDYLILTFDLSGLEELWEIAFKAVDKDVRRNTVSLLSNIQRNLDTPLQTGVTLQRKTILDRIMLRLSEEKDLNIIERCLEII